MSSLKDNLRIDANDSLSLGDLVNHAIKNDRNHSSDKPTLEEFQSQIQIKFACLMSGRSPKIMITWEIFEDYHFKDGLREYVINTNEIQYGYLDETKFLNPYLEVATVNKSHKIRIILWRENLICVMPSGLAIGYVVKIPEVRS